MTTSFITTAIPYVNARPHLGFAYELVLADVLARHRRRRGHDVRSVTGTDDNSLKNVAAAAREGLTPRALVDRNAAAFRALGPLLNVVPDDFIETSRDPRHRTAVEWLWRRCAERGDLYRRHWTGRYCAGCEAFVDDNVAICEEHGTAPEPVSEQNWFFRLSRWRAPVRDAIASGRIAILPDAARAETLAFLDGDVRDLSVSRAATRSHGWGIPAPDDPDQVIYVWFDALANYLASLGLGGDDALLARYWRDGAERIHVIGKGITRFHAVYWPAFLLSAGLPLPDRIAVHGYLTVDGKKISKSRNVEAESLDGGKIRNSRRDIDVESIHHKEFRNSRRDIDVESIVAECGVDALRWYFVRRCRTRVDADVSRPAIANAHDSDLADRLGNLVQRCVTLATKLSDGRVPAPRDTADTAALRASAATLAERVDTALDAFVFDDAVAAIVELLDAANRTLERAEPWRLHRTDPAAAAASLYAPLEAARIAAGELSPFVPGVASVIASRLSTRDLDPTWGRLAPGTDLQPGPPPLPRKNRNTP
jgi:methionyl-tRNA synthetase